MVEYFYDSMGRKIREVESHKKETLFTYDCSGRLVQKVLPNGEAFSYSYDDFGRKTSMKGFDGSIDYEYFYQGLDLVQIQDHVGGQSLFRKYSKFGELIEETNFYGFKTSWYFDTFGRKKAIYLPDESSIHYEYDKSCMILVSRKNKQGEELYRHQYLKFDPNQHVEEEKLPMGLGVAHTTHNLLERPTSHQSPFHTITLNFNANHHVTKKGSTLTGDKDYDYDPLSQLIKEGEQTYDFDALGNSSEFEINDLNQIVSSSDETFTYDPLSRLVAKDDGEKTYFLYDGDAEIGMINKNKENLQLKVLGLGIQGDIGAAIAIEIEGEIFVPLHDLQGNILAMVNVNGEIEEKYLMNAFGEKDSFMGNNPYTIKMVICGLIVNI